MRWKPPALLLAILLAATPVFASSPSPQLGSADATAIHEVIEAQLRAFRSDDSVQAFAYASPAIQSIFKNADTFMSMVRAGYKPVYRPQEVEFRDLVPVEGVDPARAPGRPRRGTDRGAIRNGKAARRKLADRRMFARALDRADHLRRPRQLADRPRLLLLARLGVTLRFRPRCAC